MEQPRTEQLYTSHHRRAGGSVLGHANHSGTGQACRRPEHPARRGRKDVPQCTRYTLSPFPLLLGCAIELTFTPSPCGLSPCPPTFAWAREGGRMVVLQNCKGGSSLLCSHLLPTLWFQHRRQDKQGDVMYASPQDISMSSLFSSVVCTTLGMAKFLGNATEFPAEVSRHDFFNSIHFGF